jgi:UDP-glucose 4-epimerase
MALKGKDITIYGDGTQTRTFCYVDDNIMATTNAFYNNQYVNDIVNIGSDIETEIVELARKIVEITGSKSKIIHLPPLAEGDMKRRVPDISKMKILTDREITSLEEGIKKVIQLGKF